MTVVKLFTGGGLVSLCKLPTPEVLADLSCIHAVIASNQKIVPPPLPSFPPHLPSSSPPGARAWPSVQADGLLTEHLPQQLCQ